MKLFHSILLFLAKANSFNLGLDIGVDTTINGETQTETETEVQDSRYKIASFPPYF